MEVVRLGQSGLSVSRLAIGTMNFGAQLDEATACRLLDRALAAGVTLFDCAEIYPGPASADTHGIAETILGKWLKTKKRDAVVLSTKLAGASQVGRGVPLPWLRGGATVLDRHHFATACEASLRRLGTDYIDLYQSHWPDRTTPMEAQLDAVSRLIEQGKVRYFGSCNETAWGITRLCATSDRSRLPRPVAVQSAYNLLQRAVERGLDEACAEERVGLIAFSPLAMGVLSGKYAHGQRPQAGRLSQAARYGAMYLQDQLLKIADSYVAVARDFGLDPVRMAYAWVASRPAVSAVLSSCANEAQLQSFLDSAELRVSPELCGALDRVRLLHDARWNQFG